MENIEIEYKVMIDKNGYEKIVNYFSNLNTFSQENIYYDTKDELLKKNNLSLRIRKVANKYISTLKKPLKEGKKEYEYECDGFNFPNEIINVLNEYNIDYKLLEKTGELKTIRSEVKIDDSLLCIDHSFYNNIEDYEIECESNSMKKAQSIIESLLNELNIPYKVSKYSKLHRALYIR